MSIARTHAALAASIVIVAALTMALQQPLTGQAPADSPADTPADNPADKPAEESSSEAAESPADGVANEIDRLVMERLVQAITQPQPVVSQQSLKLIEWIDSQSGRRQVTLGVHVRPADPALRRHLRLADGMGLVVDHVSPGSAAAKVRLQRYDVLVKFDDQLLVNEDQLKVLVASRQAGDTVELTLVRDGAQLTAAVKLQLASTDEKIHQSHDQLMHLFQHQGYDGHWQLVNDCKRCHQTSEGWTHPYKPEPSRPEQPKKQ